MKIGSNATANTRDGLLQRRGKRIGSHVIFARGGPRIRIIVQRAWLDFLFRVSERQMMLEKGNRR